MGPGQVTLRSYLTLLNFKANHRKTLVVDEGDRWTALVTTANPHDASSAHSNLGLTFQGPAVAELLDSELAVVRMAGVPLPDLPPSPPVPQRTPPPPSCRYSPRAPSATPCLPPCPAASAVKRWMCRCSTCPTAPW